MEDGVFDEVTSKDEEMEAKSARNFIYEIEDNTVNVTYQFC